MSQESSAEKDVLVQATTWPLIKAAPGTLDYAQAVAEQYGDDAAIEDGMDAAPTEPPIRFGYADPPYIGQSKRLYGGHADYAGEVNHEGLIRRLCVEFPQGWALSLSMKSLHTILPMCPPDVLVLSWVKPIAPPMGDHRHYSWEPVILRGGRRPQRHVKSHLVLSPPQFTFRETPAEHVIGEKPEGFCHWLFEAAGLLPGDALVDLFPGSGAVGRAWESYKTTGPATALWRTCETCGSAPHERCVSLKTGRPTAVHASRARRDDTRVLPPAEPCGRCSECQRGQACTARVLPPGGSDA